LSYSPSLKPLFFLIPSLRYFVSVTKNKYKIVFPTISERAPWMKPSSEDVSGGRYQTCPENHSSPNPLERCAEPAKMLILQDAYTKE
jgi:hypothetical protein